MVKNNKLGRFLIDSLLLGMLFGLLALPFSSMGLFGFKDDTASGVQVLGDQIENVEVNSFVEKDLIKPVTKSYTVPASSIPRLAPIGIESTESTSSVSDNSDIDN